jgi:tetratricopeptide (TPR) repeat protein
MSIHMRFLLLAALLSLQSGLLAQPQSSDLHDLNMKRGREAFLAGQFQEAIDHFSRAIQLSPDYVAMAYRGNAYLILKNYQQAERDLSRSIDYYLRSGRHRDPHKGFQMGNMMIVQPGQAAEVSLPMIYNNRGIARYYQGMVQDAIEDFNAALEIDPGMQLAKRNRQVAKSGQPIPNSGSSGSNTPTGQRGRFQNQYNRFSRPISVPQPRDPADLAEATEDLRELRAIMLTDEGASRGGLFGPRVPKPFEGRVIPKKGKFYRNPEVAAKSQSYVFIENVKITSRSTFIRLRVENQEEKEFLINVEKEGSPGAFFLTDRKGSQSNIYRLKKIVDGVAVYPQTTKLKPGEPIYLTLEFEKIPDRMGFCQPH